MLFETTDESGRRDRGMTFELYMAGAAAGGVALFGLYKGACAAGTAASRKADAVVRDMKTSSHISDHKKEMDEKAKERKKRMDALQRK